MVPCTLSDFFPKILDASKRQSLGFSLSSMGSRFPGYRPGQSECYGEIRLRKSERRWTARIEPEICYLFAALPKIEPRIRQ